MSLFGQHTADELQDLLTANQFKINQTESAYNANPSAADADWITDWNAFLARWQPVSDAAKAHISAILVPASIAPSEALYQSVLTALQKTPGSLQKGDLGDLMSRLTVAGIKINEAGMPQPKGTDIDEAVLKNKTIENVAKAGEAVAKIPEEVGKAAKYLSDPLGWVKEHPVATSAIVLGGLFGISQLAKRL